MNEPFIWTWALSITPLAPIHVGAGEDFDPTNYVIDGQALYSFSPEAALRALPAAERKSLLQTVNRPPDVEMIKQVQAFFHRNAERLIPGAQRVIPVLPRIAEEYRQRVGRTAQREESGREIINRLRIERTFADPATQRPILPGSSLKGAIRTALLDKVNDGNRLTRDEKDMIPHERNRVLQQRLFEYRCFEQDPMRLVQLADARDQSPVNHYATEIRYAVNRKRKEVLKNGREVASQAENLRQVLECVPPLRPHAFSGQLTLQDLGGFTGDKTPVANLRWTIEELAAACNDFYRPIFENECRELNGRSFLDTNWHEAVTQVLDGKTPALNKGRAFLVRIGRHSGAESVTLNGVRDIKIKGRGNNFEHLPKTKTYWLAANDIQDRRYLVPFGWILVEATPAGESPEPWPEALAAGTRMFAKGAEQWQAEVAQRREELTRSLEAEQKQETLRRAAEAARQAEEEQARHEQEAREAELAKLSEEARTIAQLRDRLAADQAAGRKEPGGQLAADLAAAIRGAGEWPQTDRLALAALAEDIYRHIGWGSGKKKREKRQRIEALKQDA
jgi:CRISPR-associated protein Csm5